MLVIKPVIEGLKEEKIELQPMMGSSDSQEMSRSLYDPADAAIKNRSQDEHVNDDIVVAAQLPLSESPVPESSQQEKKVEASPRLEEKVIEMLEPVSESSQKVEGKEPENDYVSHDEEKHTHQQSRLTQQRIKNVTLLESPSSFNGSTRERSSSPEQKRLFGRSYTEPLFRSHESQKASSESDKSQQREEEMLQQKEIYIQLMKEYREFVGMPLGRAAIEKVKGRFIDGRNRKALEFVERFEEALSVKSVLHMAELNRDALRSSGLNRTPEFASVAEKLDEIINTLGSHHQNMRDITRTSITNCIDLGDFVERRTYFDINARLHIDQVRAGKNYGVGGNPSGNAAQTELSYAFSLPSAPKKSAYVYNNEVSYFSRIIQTTADPHEFEALGEAITQDIREGNFVRPVTDTEAPFSINDIAPSTNPVEARHLEKILQIWNEIDNLGPEAFQDAINKFGQEHPQELAVMREEMCDLLQDQVTLGNFMINRLKEQETGKSAGKMPLTEIPSIKDGVPVITEEDVVERMDMVALSAKKYASTMKLALNEVLLDLETRHDELEKSINGLLDQMFSEIIKYKESADKSAKAINAERGYFSDRAIRGTLIGGAISFIVIGAASSIITNLINQKVNQNLNH